MTTDDLSEIATHTADPAWLLARGVFVAEGRHVTRRLLAAPQFTVLGLMVTPTAEAALADVIESLPPDRRPRVVVTPQADLDALTTFRLHQGCVAFAERRPLSAWTPMHTAGGLSVLLERVRDPDNVGSIARSASAMGVRTLLMGPECADPFYRKAIRTSMGAVLATTIVTAAPWPDVLQQLKAAGQTLVATTPDPSAPDIEDCGLRPCLRHGYGGQAADRGLILLVGSEGEGLSAEARQAADIEARIPMANDVDSLNVAVATAVAVYALSRRTL